ncbi:uncharacterized protein LOC105420084 isoform X2 [Amborella trichopoda]|uniref:uncharacterized protein LOC105420084 isoform X2 n=1 Tax=Amborella trichopoda TaxID=13333 RepID=UPI0005D2E364|nr:uncharacterized protein LOC105420084 isoform X2 [Amborella trichopoda]|eukprot:XP_011620630.1 uncharacterized protein LOC105420084 isoform X2 [Amborella trichopoda]
MDPSEFRRYLAACSAAWIASCVCYWYYTTQSSSVQIHSSLRTGSEFVTYIMNSNPRNCFNLLRMERDAFKKLCTLLRAKSLLHNKRSVLVEEQVAIFLNTVAHNERNRVMQAQFQHSGQTISYYFNKVLKAVVALGPDFLLPPGREIPDCILNNPMFYPYFKDCVGVIDGTHIPAWVGSNTNERFRNKKGEQSQNVLAAVSFDMCFQYVLAGWEGSAADSRILDSAINRETNPLRVPQRKYYLVDASYPNTHGFIAPYPDVECQFNEIMDTQAPRALQELFNHRHLSLWNIVERTFGLWKARFPILKSQSRYPFDTQVMLVIATCVLHNFIRMTTGNDSEIESGFENQVMQEMIGTYEGDENNETLMIDSQSIDDHDFGVQLREEIATQLWDDYQNS